jgi:hypothetical protein
VVHAIEPREERSRPRGHTGSPLGEAGDYAWPRLEESAERRVVETHLDDLRARALERTHGVFEAVATTRVEAFDARVVVALHTHPETRCIPRECGRVVGYPTIDRSRIVPAFRPPPRQ